MLAEGAVGWPLWGLCERRLRLLRAGHSLVQLAPMDPLQGTAEPISKGGGASVITYSGKG